jgi:membrane-bound metal-dependent hydrolase YbcI (DUF457 family)
MPRAVPLTPFHLVPVWPAYVKWPRRCDLLALSFGAVMPDLEIVTLYPLLRTAEAGRGIMHSLLGVVTVNLVLTLIAARLLAPWLASRLDRRFPGKGWRRFAGHDVVLDRKPWVITVSSAIIGGLSHLGLDLFVHNDTPLLWPWRGMQFSAVPWAWDPAWIAAFDVVIGIVFFAMLWKWVGR